MSAAPVELLHGSVQPDRAFLDQVEQREAEAAIALRDRDDEAEVAFDHAVLRLHVASFDPFREGDLLSRGE